MNELEKEILKGVDKAYSECGTNAFFGNGFRKGADFVLSKNLPVLFAEWVSLHVEIRVDDFGKTTYNIFALQSGSLIDIYDYWLNNEYGKDKS